MARRAGAAAAEALLWAAALLFGRGAASFYGADARTYALAALCSELLQLCVCAAALRAGPLAALRAILAEAASPAGPPAALAAAASVVAATIFYANLAYTEVGTTAAMLAAHGGFAELVRCRRAVPPARAASIALYAFALFLVMRPVHNPFPARHGFVLSQMALMAAAKAAARAAARAARGATAHGAASASQEGFPAPAERGLPRHAMGVVAGLLTLAAAAAWSAGGGNAAAASRHAQSACHSHFVTAANAKARGAAAFAFGGAAAAWAAAAIAAEARALRPPHSLESSVAAEAAEAGAVAAVPVYVATLLAAPIFAQPISRDVMLAAAFIAAAAAAGTHAAHLTWHTKGGSHVNTPSAGLAAIAPAAAHGGTPLLWATGDAWPRRGAMGGLAALYLAAVVGTAARRGMWLHPHEARLASWSEAPDATLPQCVLPPPLWDGKPYVVHAPRACEGAGSPFYNLTAAAHYGTLLVMDCPGGAARYTPNFYLDPSAAADAGDPENDGDGDDVAGGARVAGVARQRTYDQAGPPVVLSHKVTHVELSCTQPRGADGMGGEALRKGLLRGTERTRREIALLPGPLTRRLLMAGRGAPADPDAAAAAAPGAAVPADHDDDDDGDVARPNVIVFLLDALSRQTAASVLPNFLAALRGAEADMAPSVAVSLEYEHFGIVGMNSKPNWAAMLCGGNCSGHWAVPRTNTLPLLDAARAAGFATMHLNNFYPGYPYPWLPDGPGPEVFVPERYAKLNPADVTQCRQRDSVSHSWLRAGVAALAAPRPPGAPPLYALIAPHEAHSKVATDFDRLSRLEPALLEALRALNASGVLSTSLTVFISDHGIHFGRYYDPHGQLKERLAPACSAHRSPFFAALVGRRAARTLLAGAGAGAGAEVDVAVARARANAARLTTMHDAYATLAGALQVRLEQGGDGTPAAGLAVQPHAAALDLLRNTVPEGRTCREAAIPPGYCNCFRPAQGRDTRPWMDFVC